MKIKSVDLTAEIIRGVIIGKNNIGNKISFDLIFIIEPEIIEPILQIPKSTKNIIIKKNNKFSGKLICKKRKKIGVIII